MRTVFGLLLIMGCFISAQSVIAQKSKGETSAIMEKVKDMKKYEGFFTFYYDAKEDKVFLLIDRFDEELIYVNSLSAGVGSNDIGLDRAQLGGTRIVKMERRGPKVLMIQPNYSYRAISDNPKEVMAVKDAFAQSVIWGFKVAAEDKGKVLVDASSFLLRDAHDVTGRLRSRRQGNYSLDPTRSAFYLERTKSFPDNSEFEAILTFKGRAEGGYIRSVTPSSDAITVRQHHSFVRLPDDNYKPREFDPRAGYGGISFMDYATPISDNIQKRYISRHRLEKKDPNLEVSEAVEPIIYYLDPGTPEPILSALMDGARWWNQAYEAAGFKDAFQVKVLPDGADPMDVRYNTITWVHRSTRGWSYGSSVRDPRTGEIIKGHVSLGSLRVRQDFLIAEGLLAPYEDGTVVPPEMEKMAIERLRQLSAHEVGHTIGLSHNYSSSMDGRASVMDYPHPVASLDASGMISLSGAYDNKIGPWDKVAITYGYKVFPENTNEKEALNAILDDAYKNQNLSFISDQDARPPGGAHPRAHLWDNGTDASDELNRVMNIRAAAISRFGENNIREGVPYATLEEVLVPIYFFHRYQAEAVVKVIGGLDYTYALRGDGQKPTQLIDPEMQKNALSALMATITPQALALPESLLESIPPRPLGYRRSNEIIKLRTGLTFDALGAAESAANMTISFLLNSQRASRLVEYHARDAKQPGLGMVIDQLIANTWKTLKSNNYLGEVGRTVDMVALRNLMILAVNEDASDQARAMAFYKVNELNNWLKAEYAKQKEESQKAHFSFAMNEIDQFTEYPQRFETFEVLSPPAGSPIGMEAYGCEGY
jgi:hypothetical protein